MLHIPHVSLLIAPTFGIEYNLHTGMVRSPISGSLTEFVKYPLSRKLIINCIREDESAPFSECIIYCVTFEFNQVLR
jgi:hypothetical protein